MALKRSIKKHYTYTFQEEEEHIRKGGCTSILFFVGRCFDNFEVILM